jgi:hypothetical protein
VSSNVKFNHSNHDGSQTIAVTLVNSAGESVSRIVTQANPQFKRLAAYLAEHSEHDADTVHGLVDPSVGIGKMLQEEFGDRVSFDLHHFYLDGIPETSLLATHVKDKVLNGDTDWQRLVRFMVRLDGNPSKRAKDAVWAWVEKHGVTITEDGRMIGYKGLVRGTDLEGNDCPVSYHSGPNNFIDGKIYGEPGTAYQVPHRLGAVISKRRGVVDDNTKLACSTGLHVGGYSYAKTFGENREDGRRYSTMGKMASTFALVAFAPEDVVSVPEDGTSDWKIRVSKYEVVEFLEKVKDVLKGQPTYDVKTSAPFLPYGQEKTPDREVEPHEPDYVEPEPEVEEEQPDAGAEDRAAREVAEHGGEQEETTQPQQEVVPRDDLVEPAEGTGLFGKKSLADWANVNPRLKDDLERKEGGKFVLGNTAVAKRYQDITTESSVRRYRKDR